MESAGSLPTLSCRTPDVTGPEENLVAPRIEHFNGSSPSPFPGSDLLFCRCACVMPVGTVEPLRIFSEDSQRETCGLVGKV